MEEDMGIIFVNGKMYNLNELTQEQLRDLDRILEETEKQCLEKINMFIK